MKKITDPDHAKHVTTQEFNKLMSEKFAARLAEASKAKIEQAKMILLLILLLN